MNKAMHESVSLAWRERHCIQFYMHMDLHFYMRIVHQGCDRYAHPPC